jgi:hypothetical protein
MLTIVRPALSLQTRVNALGRRSVFPVRLLSVNCKRSTLFPFFSVPSLNSVLKPTFQGNPDWNEDRRPLTEALLPC